MPYPDNFSAAIYDRTIGSEDVPTGPTAAEISAWAAKQVCGSLAMWRDSFNANFGNHHARWDEAAFDTDCIRQMLEDAAHDAITEDE